jgi:hypothetical protein
MRLAFCVLPVEVVMRKIVSKTVAEKMTKIDTPTQGRPHRCPPDIPVDVPPGPTLAQAER